MIKKPPAKRVDIVSLKLVKESSTLYPTREIKGPDDAAQLVGNFLRDADREHFIALYLNTKKEPTAIHVVSIGTLNSSLVHPRELYKAALLTNAASVIVSHNHPSGDTNPSNEDIEITRRLQKAGEMLGIELLDHIIIGSEGKYCSFKERNIL